MSSPNLPSSEKQNGAVQPPGGQPKKEMPNELRMALAFGLMLAILVGTNWFYAKMGWLPQPKANPAAKTAQKPQSPAGPAVPSAGASPAAPAADASPAAPAAGAATAETEWTLDTNLYRIVFTNRGATVKSWTLRNFKGEDNKPLEIVNSKGALKVGSPFSYDFRAQQPTTDLNKALWVPQPASNGLSIHFEFSDGKTTASKNFAFTRDGYLVQFADEVKLGAAGLPHLVQWRGGFGDMAVQAAAGHQQGIRYDLEKKKLVEESAKSAKSGPARADGLFSFAGIEDQYFTAVFLPPPNTPLETTLFQDTVSSRANNEEDAYPGVAVGGDSRNQLALYVGPKAVSTLSKVNPRLEDIIDWGWFGIIAKPLFLILQWMNNVYVHNYGWAIIILTVAINIALLPLRIANLKSMRKMQALQPEMAKINEKYKGISMSDPKAALKQQETMDLYKKHGVNPMGGCIPMLIQLPFLYAFYKVLAVTVEMRGAEWLWIGDLSQPEHFVVRFLPIIMVATSLLMQKMTPMAAGGDPSQQKIMQFMPLMWGYFFWSASSGLVLYWLTSNLVQIVQQWFFNKATAGADKPVPAGTVTVIKSGPQKKDTKRR